MGRVQSMLFTAGLFVGLDARGYRIRYCYPNLAAAIAALSRWDGRGFPPGPWIKEKGRMLNGAAVDRSNPKSFAESMGEVTDEKV